MHSNKKQRRCWSLFYGESGCSDIAMISKDMFLFVEDEWYSRTRWGTCITWVMIDNTSMINVLSQARYGRLQQHGRQVVECDILKPFWGYGHACLMRH